MPYNYLNELSKIYPLTDKGVGESTHYYTIVYNRIMEPYRNKAKGILELGVGSGDSLRMWKQYFSHAMIYGIDNNKNYKFSEHRIKVFIGNQEDTSFLLSVCNGIKSKFDFIIDDASHAPQKILQSYRFLITYLKIGGYYFIEDINKKDIYKLLPAVNDIDFVKTRCTELYLHGMNNATMLVIHRTG